MIIDTDVPPKNRPGRLHALAALGTGFYLQIPRTRTKAEARGTSEVQGLDDALQLNGSVLHTSSLGFHPESKSRRRQWLNSPVHLSTVVHQINGALTVSRSLAARKVVEVPGVEPGSLCSQLTASTRLADLSPGCAESAKSRRARGAA